jgi:hypothetical protein
MTDCYRTISGWNDPGYNRHRLMAFGGRLTQRGPVVVAAPFNQTGYGAAQPEFLRGMRRRGFPSQFHFPPPGSRAARFPLVADVVGFIGLIQITDQKFVFRTFKIKAVAAV